MYKGKAFSPFTTLSGAIGGADTVIPVNDITVFPSAPNLATIGTDDGAETIYYAAIAGYSLSGCVRGMEGTARVWPVDSVISRNFTNLDYTTLISNITQNADDIVDAQIEISGKASPEYVASAIGVHDISYTAHSDIRTEIAEKATPANITAAITAHNSSATAHSDIRAEIAEKSTTADISTAISAHNMSSTAHDDRFSEKAVKSESVQFNLLASGWAGAAQTVTLASVSANGVVAAAISATPEQADALRNALVRITAQTSTTISFAADGEVPAVNIPMNLINLG